MDRFVASIAGSCLIALSLSAGSRVGAQDIEAPSAPRDTGSALVTPPELLEPVEPDYPEAARARRLEAEVRLQLRIDAAGHVSEAHVLEPAGHGFDEAAKAAALRLVFAPARYRGRPIPGMVLHRFHFHPPPHVGIGAEPAPTPMQGPAEAAGPPGPETIVGGEDTLVVGGEEPLVVGGEDTLVVGSGGGSGRTGVVGGGDPIVVVGEAITVAQQLQRSAEAVQVIETRQAKGQSADLGEVLARTQGVGVRRQGGLGSNTRFTLNGLSDDQVRFFLDGVPLDLSGFPFGIANVPVNLVDRVEVYRGVVPIRFGADALGGAVNLVSPETRRSSLGGSYQIGSFGTHRATLDGRYRHEPSGLFAGATAFVDSADNDYEVTAGVPDGTGQEPLRRVRRFHDAYRAYGGTVQVGVADRSWARRLQLTGFASTYDKELQHDVVMETVYGEPTYGDTVAGATARYEVALSSRVDLQLTAAYSHRIIDFHDAGEWYYDWLGRRIRARTSPGEVNNKPSDSTLWQNAAFGRAVTTWQLVPEEHIVRLSLSPAFTARTGKERLLEPGATDPLNAERRLLTFVAGLEYEVNLFDERLSNVVFVKDYVYRAETEELPPGGMVLRRGSVNKHSQGIGDALRYRFTPWLYAKLSYEYATRMPRPDEVFGNGALVRANLKLQPEVSHNVNIGPRIELKATPIGDLVVDVNAFLRLSDRLIVLLGDVTSSYQNVYRARGFGLENAVSWMSPGRWLGLDGMLTWQDIRNASKRDAFGEDVEGDRIPNRPYLFGSWGARVHVPGMPGGEDSLEPFYYGRYVHSFFRAWESIGATTYKADIDSQVTHDLGLSWLVSRELARMTATVEVQNVSDARVYDNFGVQRPGRAFYAKLVGTMP